VDITRLESKPKSYDGAADDPASSTGRRGADVLDSLVVSNGV
jgi:hypothetical protein